MSSLASYLMMLGNAAGLIGFIAFAHNKLGDYPKPLPKNKDTGKELIEALLIWGFVFTSVFVFVYYGWVLDSYYPYLPLGPLNIPLHSIIVLIFPVAFVTLVNHWGFADLGFRKSFYRKPAFFAIIIGLLWGIVPAFFETTSPIPVPLLLYYIYTPAFLEELVHRGIIQSKLERALGQQKAWLLGGILFGLVHIPTDFFGPVAASYGDIMMSFLALAGQIAAGWFWGVLYIKTRNLIPCIASHYLINFASGIIVWFM
ncbi:MAG: CPBP family intramembrane metalloprotease [Candidatus Thorarchaeota archaeon]|nr:CPBP family intramembrane metalloprotease [Candidatus Thorarchaeota archaeon]